MQHLVEKFPNRGDLVVDLLSGTFATAKACLDLARQRRFVGCKTDSERFSANTEPVVETYARRVLIGKSDLLCTDEVLD